MFRFNRKENIFLLMLCYIRKEISSYKLSVILSTNSITKITILSFEITFKSSILYNRNRYSNNLINLI